MCPRKLLLAMSFECAWAAALSLALRQSGGRPFLARSAFTAESISCWTCAEADSTPARRRRETEERKN